MAKLYRKIGVKNNCACINNDKTIKRENSQYIYG